MTTMTTTATTATTAPDAVAAATAKAIDVNEMIADATAVAIAELVHEHKNEEAGWALWTLYGHDGDLVVTEEGWETTRDATIRTVLLNLSCEDAAWALASTNEEVVGPILASISVERAGRILDEISDPVAGARLIARAGDPWWVEEVLDAARVMGQRVALVLEERDTLISVCPACALYRAATICDRSPREVILRMDPALLGKTLDEWDPWAIACFLAGLDWPNLRRVLRALATVEAGPLKVRHVLADMRDNDDLPEDLAEESTLNAMERRVLG